MFQQRIDRSVLTDPSWWHWTLTIPLLTLNLAGSAGALHAAAGLCFVMTVYYLIRVQSLKKYPVQIRLAYIGWLYAGTLPGLGWMHWIQLFGTTAMVTVGYCPLARLLNLLPFNRTEQLSPAYVLRNFFRDPCVGGLIVWSDSIAGFAPACSIRPAVQHASCSLASRPIDDEGTHHAATH